MKLPIDLTTLTSENTKELLDVAVRILPAWLNGELQSHRKLPLLPHVELSSVSDYKKLGKWLVYVRGLWLENLPDTAPLMFTAYRAKKEVEHGENSNWQSPTGPLTTWYPDAVRAITSANNQGQSNVTTLLQTTLNRSEILIDADGMIVFLDWVKTNRLALLKSAKVSSKQLLTQKPEVLASVKRTRKIVQQSKPLLAYITKPITVTIIGSYNAAGG